MACSSILSDSTTYLTPEEWGGCAIPFFRALVGDFEDPPIWSDSRAIEILKVAAYQVITDLSACSTISKPTINLCTGEFSSNPYLHAGFFNLWQLKAAAIVDQGLVRSKAMIEGIHAVCGPASLKVINGDSNYSLLFRQGPTKAYESMKEELCFRNPISSAASCSQIVGTFVSEYLGDRCHGSCSRYR